MATDKKTAELMFAISQLLDAHGSNAVIEALRDATDACADHEPGKRSENKFRLASEHLSAAAKKINEAESICDITLEQGARVLADDTFGGEDQSLSDTPKPYRPKPRTLLVGSKFEQTRGLTIAQVAKLVRADIKAATDAGTLAAARYSVRSSHYSQGCEISVSIDEVQLPGFSLFNQARIAWDLANPYAGLCNAPPEVFALYSEQARALIAQVEAIVNEYNRRSISNEADDGGHSHHHVEVSFASGAWREAQRERATAALAVTEPAPAMPANDVEAVLAVVLAADFADEQQADYLAHLGAL